MVEAFTLEIHERAERNLTEREFAERTDFDLPMKGHNPGGSKEHQRKWPISNTGKLQSTGKFKVNRSKLHGEVEYSAPYAEDVDRGAPPHWPNFDRLYDWAWYRRNEPDFPDLKKPSKKDKEFWRFYNRYRGKSIGGHRFTWKVFIFCYLVAKKHSKNGVEPSFYFSDAVYSVFKDGDEVLKRYLKNKRRYEVK